MKRYILTVSSMFIFLDYLSWHYGDALRAILVIQKNYILGVWHRFLISQHFRTLFSPWHRRQPSDSGGPSNIGEKILNAIADFYIRILAALVRSTIIITGLICCVVIYVVFWLVFIFWLLWPLIFIVLFIKGLSLIFRL